MRPPLIPMIAIALLTSLAGNAQLKGFSIGAYAESAWPTGDAADRLKNGFGGGVTADVKLPAKLGITGSAGFQRFAGQPVQGGALNPTVFAFPVRAGLKFRPLPLFYLKMEAGTAKLSDNGGTAFILSPGIGIRVLGIDVQGKYETWDLAQNISFWGVRAAFNF